MRTVLAVLTQRLGVADQRIEFKQSEILSTCLAGYQSFRESQLSESVLGHVVATCGSFISDSGLVGKWSYVEKVASASCAHVLESERLDSLNEFVLTGLCYRIQRGEPFLKPRIDRCDVVSRRLSQKELRYEYLVQRSIRFPPRILGVILLPPL